MANYAAATEFLGKMVEDGAAAMEDHQAPVEVPQEANPVQEVAQSEATWQAPDDGSQVVEQTKQEAAGKAAPDKKSQRYQKLANRAREAEERLTKVQEQYAREMAQLRQAQQYQMQLQQQAIQEQQVRFQEQMGLLQRKAEAEQYEKLSPLDKFKLDTLREAETRLNPALDSKVQPLNGRLDQIEAKLSGLVENLDRRERIAAYDQEVKESVKKYLTPDPEAYKSLGPVLKEMVIAYAGGFGVSIPEAAQRLKNSLESYARANPNAIKGKSVQEIQATNQRMGPTPRGAPGTQGKVIPKVPPSRNMTAEEYLGALLKANGMH